MPKFAIAFLGNPNPNLRSHALKSEINLVCSFFFKALLGRGSSSTATNPEGGAVGPLSEVSMGALETEKEMEKKPRRKKADNLKQEMRGTDGPLLRAEIPAVEAKAKVTARPTTEGPLLHAEIPAVKAKAKATARPKTSGKSKKIPITNVEEGLDHSVAGEEVCTLVVKAGDVEPLLHAEISAVKAKAKATARPKTSDKSKKIPITNVVEGLDHSVAGEKVCLLVVKARDVTSGDNGKAVQNTVTEKAAQVAFNAKTFTDMIQLKKDFSQYAAQLDLKGGCQWEETAHKLLDHGISPAHVIKMLQKCRNSSCGRSVDSSLKHFVTLGMSNEVIGRVISRWPNILNTADSKFQRKVEFFESVGIDRRTLGKIINVTAMAITNSLSTLQQHCDFWNDYMQDIQVNAFSVLISKNPRILTCSMQSRMLPKIAYLDEQGFDKKMLFKYPSILCLSLETIASKAKLLEQFGMSSTKRRSWGLAVLHGLSIPRLRIRFKNLLAIGFSLDQARRIMLLCPGVLALREDYIHLKVSYAVNVMKLPLDALVATPTYLTSSYERRIRYRYEVMQELRALGGLQKNLSLKYMISMTDALFIRHFVDRLDACAKCLDAPNV